jgi:hypothetical protein
VIRTGFSRNRFKRIATGSGIALSPASHLRTVLSHLRPMIFARSAVFRSPSLARADISSAGVNVLVLPNNSVGCRRGRLNRAGISNQVCSRHLPQIWPEPPCPVRRRIFLCSPICPEPLWGFSLQHLQALAGHQAKTALIIHPGAFRHDRPTSFDVGHILLRNWVKIDANETAEWMVRCVPSLGNGPGSRR